MGGAGDHVFSGGDGREGHDSERTNNAIAPNTVLKLRQHSIRKRNIGGNNRTKRRAAFKARSQTVVWLKLEWEAPQALLPQRLKAQLTFFINVAV